MVKGVISALVVFGLTLFVLVRLTSTEESEPGGADAPRAAIDHEPVGLAPAQPAVAESAEPPEPPEPDPDPLIEDFKLLGDTDPATGRVLCSDDARSQMAEFAVSIEQGDVVVREDDWSARGTSGRISLASWYAHCTRDGRAVRILGDESGKLLAEYHPRTGYREPDRRIPHLFEFTDLDR